MSRPFHNIVLALWVLAAGRQAGADDSLFDDQIAPIFERRCVACHHGDDAKAGLRLTTRRELVAGGENGPAVVPGNPDASLLLDFVSGDEPSMPKNAPPLSAAERGALRRWIVAGAPWPEGAVLVDRRFEGAAWWSLAPLAEVHPPAADDPWVRTPIDAFVLATLRREGLRPSPEADRRTLVRRVTFDLHGLPPTPDEIDDFVADQAPDAYSRLVDRLLASPRYGERWGRHWLDVVHFGETHGYDKDKTRPHAWPYREYVIAAINADVPYSRFVSEQLAGDVIDPDNPRAIEATGFLAAGPWDYVGHVELREGTVDKAIARSNDRDDMVMTAMSTFQSLTVHCARCHDHKFDPIRQADYYRLQAVFAGIDRADRPYDADPRVASRRRALLDEQRSLAARAQAVRVAVAGVTNDEIAAIDRQLSQLDERLSPAASRPKSAATSAPHGYHTALCSDRDEPKWVQVDLGVSRPIDMVVLYPAHVAYGGHPGPGFGFPPRFKIEVSDDPAFAASRLVADHASADYANPGDRACAFDGAGHKGRYVRLTATRLWNRSGAYIMAMGEMVVVSAGANVANGREVSALDTIEAGRAWGQKFLVDGARNGQAVDDPATLVQRRFAEREREALLRQREQRVEARLNPATRDARRAVSQREAEVARELAALPPQQSVYAGTHAFRRQGNFTPAAAPRPVYLLHRGDVKQPGDAMPPGALACLPGLAAEFVLETPDDEGARRAALATWITDPRNALTRRSIVNRVWHYHFGRGLVDTPNDFGRMGSLPTHPELLEWLAGDFLRCGESLKQLHRQIVTSATYRQVSTARPEGQRADAGNRFLWRMNRSRLDAEAIHDSVLLVSGQLDTTLGGPSVQQFFFKDDHSPIYDYDRFDVDDPRNRRRSVYRFIVRSVPDPFMECLDCADPSLLTPARNTTLTALQALAMLNDRFVVRQAEHFAARLASMSADPAEQIRLAYRLGLGRVPTSDEGAVLARYGEKHGLANACRVIFNLNEFLFVD